MANSQQDAIIGVRNYVGSCVTSALSIVPVLGAPRKEVSTLPYARVSSSGQCEHVPMTPTVQEVKFTITAGAIFDVSAIDDSESVLWGYVETLRNEIEADPHAGGYCNDCEVTASMVETPEESHGDRGHIELTISVSASVLRNQ